LRWYLHVVRYRWRLALLVMVVTVAVAALWLLVRTPQYTATAELLVTPLAQSDEIYFDLPVVRDAGDPTRTIQTAATQVDTPPAAALAARRLGGGWTQDAVLGATDVEPVGETNLLAVTGSADDAEQARRLADAYADGVLAWRDQTLRARVAPTIARLQTELGGLTADDGTRRADVLDRLDALRAARASGDPTISKSRTASAGIRSGPSSRLLLLIALVVGCALAVGAAVLAELSSAGRRPHEARPAPAPPFPRDEPAAEGKTPPALAPDQLAQRLAGRRLGDSRSVLVAGLDAHDDPAAATAALARALANAGERAIALDLSAAGGGLGRELGFAATPVKSGRSKLATALRPVSDAPRLRFVAVPLNGTEPARDPGAVLADLLSDAMALAPWVLVTGPPLLADGGAVAFLRAADDVVVASREDPPDLVALDTAQEIARAAGTSLTAVLASGGGGP
jgi:capsular polysaccharide biosynthesis protein